MSELVPWSWSRIELFEKCPRQFFECNISKTVKFDNNAPHFVKGRKIHALHENALKTGHIDPEIRQSGPIIDKLRSVDWDYMGVEAQYAWDVKMQPTNWFVKKWETPVLFRIAYDFLGVKFDKALAVDWKTGKDKSKEFTKGYGQLDMYACGAFLANPEVEEIKSTYEFVDHGTRKVIKRTRKKDFDHMWDDFQERADRIQVANQTGDWPEKPSDFNCKWCDVLTCKYNKKRV